MKWLAFCTPKKMITAQTKWDLLHIKVIFYPRCCKIHDACYDGLDCWPAPHIYSYKYECRGTNCRCLGEYNQLVRRKHTSFIFWIWLIRPLHDGLKTSPDLFFEYLGEYFTCMLKLRLTVWSFTVTDKSSNSQRHAMFINWLYRRVYLYL